MLLNVLAGMHIEEVGHYVIDLTYQKEDNIIQRESTTFFMYGLPGPQWRVNIPITCRFIQLQISSLNKAYHKSFFIRLDDLIILNLATKLLSKGPW